MNAINYYRVTIMDSFVTIQIKLRQEEGIAYIIPEYSNVKDSKPVSIYPETSNL